MGPMPASQTKFLFTLWNIRVSEEGYFFFLEEDMNFIKGITGARHRMLKQQEVRGSRFPDL